MNEEQLLKTFAKARGAEDTLEKIEKKKIQQENMLKGMAKLLGTEDLLKEIENKKAKEKLIAEEKKRLNEELAEEKKRREENLLQMLNLSLEKLISNNEEQVIVIEQELNKVIPFVNHPDKNVTEDMVVISAEETLFKDNSPKKKDFKILIGDGDTPKQITFEDLQKQPELPDNFMAAVVKDISKTSTTLPSGENNNVPDPFRKELDQIKKSIVDLHRFAQRHSQHGGGGEVNLRYLDDIDRSSIGDGLFLKYDAGSKKFIFATPPGSATTLEGLTDIVVTDKSDGAVVQYNSNDDKYHIQQLSITGASLDAGNF